MSLLCFQLGLKLKGIVNTAQSVNNFSTKCSIAITIDVYSVFHTFNDWGISKKLSLKVLTTCIVTFYIVYPLMLSLDMIVKSILLYLTFISTFYEPLGPQKREIKVIVTCPKPQIRENNMH